MASFPPQTFDRLRSCLCSILYELFNYNYCKTVFLGTGLQVLGTVGLKKNVSTRRKEWKQEEATDLTQKQDGKSRELRSSDLLFSVQQGKSLIPSKE